MPNEQLVLEMVKLAAMLATLLLVALGFKKTNGWTKTATRRRRKRRRGGDSPPPAEEDEKR